MTRRSALDAIFDSTARIDEEGSDNMAEHRRMLSSLKKLYDASEIDIDSTLAQLTDPVIKRFSE